MKDRRITLAGPCGPTTRPEWRPAPATLATDWQRVTAEARETALAEWRRREPLPEWAGWWQALREGISALERSQAGPPRTNYPSRSSIPEAPPDVTWWQLQAGYIRGDLEELPETESRPPLPSAREISTAEAVLDLFHGAALVGLRNRRLNVTALHMWAAGVPPRVILSRTGVRRRSLDHYRALAMGDMDAEAARILRARK